MFLTRPTTPPLSARSETTMPNIGIQSTLTSPEVPRRKSLHYLVIGVPTRVLGPASATLPDQHFLHSTMIVSSRGT